MHVGTNLGVGVCMGVGRMVDIVCGFVCMAFKQVLLDGIPLIMVFIAYLCFNVFKGFFCFYSTVDNG